MVYQQVHYCHASRPLMGPHGDQMSVSLIIPQSHRLYTCDTVSRTPTLIDQPAIICIPKKIPEYRGFRVPLYITHPNQNHPFLACLNEPPFCRARIAARSFSFQYPYSCVHTSHQYCTSFITPSGPRVQSHSPSAAIPT